MLPYPSKLNIEMMFPEICPFLKNLRAIPGEKLSVLGSAARDNLAIPWSAPWNKPVYPSLEYWLATNLTFPQAPKGWIHLTLPAGMVSSTLSMGTDMLERANFVVAVRDERPAPSKVGRDPYLVASILFQKMSLVP